MKLILKMLLPLLLLIFIVAPGVTGFLVESAVEENQGDVGTLMKSSPFELLDNDFRRGWFQSGQTTELGIKEPRIVSMLQQIAGASETTTRPSLVVETTAAHGVIPLANPEKGGFKPAVAQTESELFLKYNDGRIVDLPFTVYSSLGLGEWAKIDADPIKEIITTDRGTVDLDWQGGTVQLTRGSSITAAGDLKQLKLHSDQGSLEWSALAFKSDVTMGQYAFADSDNSIEISSAKFTSVDKSEVSLDDFRMQGGVEAHNGRALATGQITSGPIMVAGLTIDTTDAAMRYNVDAVAFSALYELLKQQPSALTQNDNSAPAVADSAAIFAALGKLATQGARVTIEKFDIALNGESISLAFDLEIPPDYSDPVQALRNGTGNGEFTIPQSVVDLLSQVKPEIGSAVQMGAGFGFIKKQGNNYSTTIVFENGVLLLNDLPVPLPL